MAPLSKFIELWIWLKWV